MINITKSIKLKNELDSLRPLSKEDELRIMQKFRLDWNYHSNHLEGNTLTYGETKALILFGITAQGKPLKDHFEITGHDEAIKFITDIIKQERPLTENFIRELHKLILKESYEVDAITPDGKPTKKRVKVGEYKSIPNHVKTKTGEIFRFATPEETPAKMHDLIKWYREKLEDKAVNPILLAAEFHYKFIRIHPFDDGNGRTARILMNFILMQFSYPPVIIKTEDKQNYFGALQQADAGLLEPFIEYIAKNLNNSLEIMIKGAKGESIEEPDDIDKEIALLDQKLKVARHSSGIFKNKEDLSNLVKVSVVGLLEKFIEKGKLLKRFYVDHAYGLFLDNHLSFKTKEEIIDNINVIITSLLGKDSSILLLFWYKKNNQVGFGKFDYTSKIQFQFDKKSYKVKNNAKVSFKKNYREQLTEKEITELVSSEIRKHTTLIETKLEEFKNKK